jgi:hypothetical protein
VRHFNSKPVQTPLDDLRNDSSLALWSMRNEYRQAKREGSLRLVHRRGLR